MQKLLGIKNEKKLSFNNHVDEICKRVGQKLNPLSRDLHELTNAACLLNAFFLSQCSYCPLVWMFHSRGKNNKINRLHERCLRIINSGKKYTLIELLQNDNSV